MIRIAAIAALLWAAATAPAKAGFLIPLAFGAAFAATATGIILSTALTIGASIALSYAASKLLAKDQVQAAEQVGGAQLSVQFAADIPQSLIVGRAVTAGSMVYTETFGARGNIDNSDLVEVIAVADHPVDGFEQLFVDAQAVTLSASDTGSGPFGGEAANRGMLVDGYQGKLAIQYYDGTQSTVDAFASAALGAHPDRPYTSDMVGVGVSYFRVHSIYDPNIVTGPMRWRVVVRGIRLYDPRKDSTVSGGSGAHRWGVLATHEWTDNVAVIVYNILRGIRVASSTGALQHFYGIEGTPAANLPLDNWFAAMNEADVVIDGVKQFRAGGEIKVSTAPLDTIKALLLACDGRLSELGGTYKLHIGSPGLPVAVFDDGGLRADEGDVFSPILPLQQRINYVTAGFLSPADGWTPKVAPPRSAGATVEAADGRRVEANLDLTLVQDPAQVQRLQQQMLRRARRERRHTIPLPPAVFGLEPGDFVEWTSAQNGYVSKLFEVDSVDLHENLTITASIIETDPTDYDWNGSVDFVDQPATSLTVDRPAPKIIEGFNATAFVDTGSDDIARPAIKVTWTPPTDGDLSRVEVEVRRSALLADVSTLSTDVPASGAMILRSSLTPSTTYQVRGRFVSFNGYGTEWSLWQDVTTPDVRVIQAELSRQLDAKVRQINDQVAKVLATVQQSIDTIQASLAGQVAGVLEEAGRIRIGVGARYQQNLASVQQAFIAIADAQESVAAILTLLDTTYATNASVASAEASAITIATSNANSAIATAISSLSATYATLTQVATAKSEAISTAEADASGALAAFSQSLLATGPGGSASGKFRINTASTVSGAIVTIALEANVSTTATPDWQPSGLYIDAMPGFSRVRIVANLFEMSDPNINGGTPFPLFSVGGGEALFNVLVRAAKIAATAIEAGTITTGKLAADSAVYNRNYSGSGSSSFHNSTSSTVVLMAAVFPVERGNILIGANVSGSCPNGWVGDSVTCGIYADGGLIKTINTGVGTVANGFFAFGDNTIVALSGVAINNHTIEVRMTGTGIGGVVSDPARTFSATATMMFLEPRT